MYGARNDVATTSVRRRFVFGFNKFYSGEFYYNKFKIVSHNLVIFCVSGKLLVMSQQEFSCSNLFF